MSLNYVCQSASNGLLAWREGSPTANERGGGGERGMFITAHIDVEEEAEPRVSCQHEFKHRLSLFQIVVYPI